MSIIASKYGKNSERCMKKIVFLTGAGASAESGIRTFRDSDGLWEEYSIEDVCTPAGYARNPQLVLDFYNERRRQLLTVKPNRCHELISSLQDRFDVQVITQNVDNLHERAGSRVVLHLHGELTKVTSSKNPNDARCIRELSPNEYDVKIGDLASDGSQLRPFIVWFGESVPNIEKAAMWTMEADILVIIGTSLNVYPAAGLINYAPKGIPIYLIDPSDVDTKGFKGITYFKTGAGTGMEKLVDLLQGL